MGGPAEIEWGPRTPWLALGLKARGHLVRPAVMTSGTHVLVRRGGIIEGGADPRREGVALGD
jgi:gamma-glutamyltranspeptidase/glutathione hydrolase